MPGLSTVLGLSNMLELSKMRGLNDMSGTSVNPQLREQQGNH